VRKADTKEEKERRKWSNTFGRREEGKDHREKGKGASLDIVTALRNDPEDEN